MMKYGLNPTITFWFTVLQLSNSIITFYLIFLQFDNLLAE